MPKWLEWYCVYEAKILRLTGTTHFTPLSKIQITNFSLHTVTSYCGEGVFVRDVPFATSFKMAAGETPGQGCQSGSKRSF